MMNYLYIVAFSAIMTANNSPPDEAERNLKVIQTQ